MTEPHIFGKPTEAAQEAAEIEQIQKELTGDVKEGLQGLAPVLAQSKLKEHQVFSESVANGGPASSQGAVLNLLDHVKYGVRHLAVDIKMPRKKLQMMLRGEIDMPAAVVGQIWDAIEKKRPGELDRLRNMTFND